MRVIAGSARSLKLVTKKGMETRPTTDRLKETLFNVLQFELCESNFLDIFAGSGGIGIEALSRGAKNAVFIENDKIAISCIEENLEHTKFSNKAKLLKQDVFTSLSCLEYKEVFDIVFMDPPYHKELEKKVLEYLTTSAIINDKTIIIFESALDTDISFLETLPYEITKIKDYKTNRHVFVQRRLK